MTIEERQRHSARGLDPNNSLAVVAPSQTFETVSAQISNIVLERKTPLFWWCTFGVGVFLLLVFAIAIVYLVAKGIGIWGVEIPVAWAFAITSFEHIFGKCRAHAQNADAVIREGELRAAQPGVVLCA